MSTETFVAPELMSALTLINRLRWNLPEGTTKNRSRQ